MRVNGDGHVIIDDHFVCEFMSKHGTEEFMATCESLIRSVCLVCSQKATSDADELMLKVNPWGKKIVHAVLTHVGEMKKDFTDLKTELKSETGPVKVDPSEFVNALTNLKTEMVTNENVVNAIRVLNASVDNIKDKIDGAKRTEEIGHLQKTVDNIQTRVEHIATVRNTTRYKGEEGESGIVHILESKLPLRDGYEILETKSKPHNCDALVKRIGFPDVRIEVKAHGRETGECVRTSEVKRFESDLIGLNNHGLFVSVYSGIVGKSPIEIDLLPTNKFAVYISNNNYDGDTLKEFINLIYKLDGFVSSQEGVKISTEAMTRIKAHLTDFNTKITALKTNMRASIEILNGFTVDIIEKLLSSGLEMKPAPLSEPKFKCDTCGRDFSRASSLSNHVKTCTKTEPNSA